MELHKALKDIVASKGTDMINNIQIINYLLDYQAFKEKPATKLILRDIINSGYAESILALSKQGAGWKMNFAKYQHEFIDSCGYKEELAIYVFEAIAYGLGLIVSDEEPEIKPAFNVDSFFEIPEVAQKPQSQPRTSQQAPQVAPTDLYTISLSFFKEGKYKQAKGFIERAIAQYSSSNVPSSYLKLMGDIQMNLASYQEAINYYNECFTRKASESRMPVDVLRDSLKQHKVNGFENSMFCYFFCLYQAKGMNDAQWLQFVKAEARFGIFDAIKYCADNGINPIDNQSNLYFTDRDKLKNGDYLFMDGSFAHELLELSSAKTAIARIVLTDTSDYEKSQAWTHGYIIPLDEIIHKKLDLKEWQVSWSLVNENLPFPHSHFTVDDLKHWDKIQKIESEQLIKIVDYDKYPVFKAVKNFALTIPMSDTSQWFLPSIHTFKRIESKYCLKQYYFFWTSSQSDLYRAIAYAAPHLYEIRNKNELHSVMPIAAF